MRLPLLALLCSVSVVAAQNLNELPPDLTLPPLTSGLPTAGQRVKATTTGWQDTAVYHALWLPPDWHPGATWPVLVEFPGNGGYRNDLGDTSDGSAEGSTLGYGLSGGHGYLWVSLPFIEGTGSSRQNCAKWWGDIEETKRYTIASVAEVCARHGGDPKHVVLCGFSRGAIAANYLGLHDDTIAPLWCAFFCHSHYDGVRRWPYPGSDPATALARLQRLRGRPQWISHEGSVEVTRRYLEATGVTAPFTLVPLPFPNHSAAWVLRDLPLRQQARAWLQSVAPTPAAARPAPPPAAPSAAPPH